MYCCILSFLQDASLSTSGNLGLTGERGPGALRSSLPSTQVDEPFRPRDPKEVEAEERRRARVSERRLRVRTRRLSSRKRGWVCVNGRAFLVTLK